MSSTKTLGPKPFFTSADFLQVDPRIIPYVSGWKLTESWQGNPALAIPDYTSVNYFEDLDKGGDTSQYEKQLTIWMGWAGRDGTGTITGQFDRECEITLSVNGPLAADITKPTNVNLEVLKSGGASMLLYFNNKLVTDFTSIGQVYAIVGNKIQLVTARYPNGYQTRVMQNL